MDKNQKEHPMPATDQSAEPAQTEPAIAEAGGKRRPSLEPRDAALLRVSMLSKELRRISPELLAVIVYATDGFNSPNFRRASDHERKLCQLLLGEAATTALCGDRAALGGGKRALSPVRS